MVRRRWGQLQSDGREWMPQETFLKFLQECYFMDRDAAFREWNDVVKRKEDGVDLGYCKQWLDDASSYFDY